MMNKPHDIVSFAKKVLSMHLFDYEEKQLRKYSETIMMTTHNEWVRPPLKHQRTYNIWRQYQEYIK